MSGKYYIAVDCEGVACAVGTPGVGLADSENYRFACLQATREANAAVRALFDAGADEVTVWDAHGSGINLLYDELDGCAVHRLPRHGRDKGCRAFAHVQLKNAANL